MNKCIKCGNEAVRTEKYLIGGKDMFSFVKFDGAAKVGVCGSCAKPYASRQLTKLLLIGIVTFLVGFLMLIVALTDGLKGNMWAFAIMIVGLGSGFTSIAGYLVKRKKIADTDEYLKSLEPEEYHTVVTKLLNHMPEISEGVIVNWPVLSAKRDMADFSDPEFVKEIRKPFRLGINGDTVLNQFADISKAQYLPIPGYGTDKSLDEQGIALIRSAIMAYERDEA